jgi:dihydrofolate synthase/folylpolyglutamate synthase
VDFRDAESYLLSLGNEVETMKLGLDNIRKLLAALGNPQNNYLKVQVAGTNGKGSVCAFLDSICREACIKAGVFTSPHLVSITERVRVNGFDISEADFARYATVVRDTAERMVTNGELEYTPTFFEQVTAIALSAFADAKVELAILETGLGGRLDATTAGNAEIVAVTRVDLDHQEYLGNILTEIAAEKAAIISDGAKVVVGEQASDAMDIIMSVCCQHGVEPVLADQVRTTCGSGSLKFMTEQARYGIERLGLLGKHQVENAKVAILLAKILETHFPITTQHIIGGLENARHPGRLEFHGQYLFDGAHNICGAKALREFMDEFVDQPVTMIIGVANDKDVAGMGKILFPKAERVILTKMENSRSMTAQEIQDTLPECIDATIQYVTLNVGEALAKANEIAEEDGLIVVTGSLYLVGEVKKLLKFQMSNLKFEI